MVVNNHADRLLVDAWTFDMSLAMAHMEEADLALRKSLAAWCSLASVKPVTGFIELGAQFLGGTWLWALSEVLGVFLIQEGLHCSLCNKGWLLLSILSLWLGIGGPLSSSLSLLLEVAAQTPAARRPRDSPASPGPDNSQIASSWLKGRQPFISLEQFQQHWGEQGALYQVSTGALYQPDATPQLTVLWTVQHPTPIPMGPGG